jgi:acetyl-CoA carboxylase biotin carboxyl carrier protein
MRAKKRKGGDGGEATPFVHADTVRLVEALADIIEARQLGEVVVDSPELTVTLRRGASAQVVTPAVFHPMAAAPVHHAPAAAAEARSAAPAAGEPAAEAGNGHHHLVTSPFVGTFYRRPNPDADTYVEIGARVDKGTVLCIVEAMKLMNEIEADVAGTVVAVLVDDAQPVEYGQALFKIDPA